MLMILEEIREQNYTMISLLQESIKMNKKEDAVNDLPFDLPLKTTEEFQLINSIAADADIKGKLV